MQNALVDARAFQIIFISYFLLELIPGKLIARKTMPKRPTTT
jgi:hypothetical protein